MKISPTIVILIYLVPSICLTNFQTDSKKRVYDVVRYTGKDLELRIKIQLMFDYVDYFVVLQEVKRVQKFKILRFEEFSHKVLYLPVRNIPHLKQKLSKQQQAQNDKVVLDAGHTMLKQLIHPQDIILLSEQEDVIPRSIIQKYLDGKMNYQCLKMRVVSLEGEHAVDSSGQNLLQVGSSKIMLESDIQSKFGSNHSYIRNQLNCSESSLRGWKIVNKTKFSYSFQKMRENTEEFSLFKTVELSRTKFNKIEDNLLKQRDTVIPLYGKGSNRRYVIDSFPYNGEDNILMLRLQITESFVDYYIVNEGHFSHLGQYKELVFNISNFRQYAHRIIYHPFRNFPYKNWNSETPDDRKWANNGYNLNSASQIVKKIARSHDIILIGDIDEIISRHGMISFNLEDGSSIAELLISYHYFNQMSAYKKGDQTDVPNYVYGATNIVVMETLQQKFGGLLGAVRGTACNQDVSSREINKKTECKQQLITRAGWHFSSVLDDAGILKKIRQSADWNDTKKQIPNLEAFRSRIVAPNSHNFQLDLFSGLLPIQLVRDILLRGKQSIYYKYCMPGVEYEVLKFREDLVLNYMREHGKISDEEFRKIQKEEARLDFLENQIKKSINLESESLKQNNDNYNALQVHLIIWQTICLVLFTVLIYMVRKLNNNRFKTLQKIPEEQEARLDHHL